MKLQALGASRRAGPDRPLEISEQARPSRARRSNRTGQARLRRATTSFARSLACIGKVAGSAGKGAPTRARGRRDRLGADRPTGGGPGRKSPPGEGQG